MFEELKIAKDGHDVVTMPDPVCKKPMSDTTISEVAEDRGATTVVIG